MNILAIDTTTGKASVAIYSNKTLVGWAQNHQQNMQAEDLFPLIEQVFEQTGLDYASINYLAASTGPGSFTGIRIGLSAAKGISFAAKNVGIISCSNFEVMAFRAMRQTAWVKNIVVIFPCDSQTLYLQSFDKYMKEHAPAQIIKISDFADYLANFSTLTAIAGNGIEYALSHIARCDNFIILPRYPQVDARLLGALAMYKVRFNKPISNLLEPLYIKPVSAKAQSYL